MLSTTTGARATKTRSLWMGSQVSPVSPPHESKSDARPEDLCLHMPVVSPAETEVNGPTLTKREDSMSSLESLDNDQIDDNDGVMEPAEAIVSGKIMPGVAQSRLGAQPAPTRTQLNLGKGERTGTCVKERIFCSYKWKPKMSRERRDMSTSEAERLEKELHVDDIQKSLNDVLLEEDDMGI